MLRTLSLSFWKKLEQKRSRRPQKSMRGTGHWIRPCLETLEDRTLLSASSPSGLLQEQMQTFMTNVNQMIQTNINQMIQQFIRAEAAALQPLLKLLPVQPTVNATINGSPAVSQVGTTINLTSSASEQGQLIPHQPIFSYDWSVTKNGAPYASGHQAGFSFTPDSGGIYVVSLTATDLLGRKGTTTVKIDPPGAPQHSLPSIAITGVPSQLSLGATISASSTVTDLHFEGQQAGFTYRWSVKQAGANGAVLASGNQANFSFTPSMVGNYVITLSATDSGGRTGSTQQAVSVTGSLSNLILLPPSQLASLQQQAKNNTTQWQAFKAVLDQELPLVVGSGIGFDGGAYEGSELTWIANYALGYQILKTIDPATAANYADKAIAVMKSGLNDYQKGQEMGIQYIARGDGSTATFTLPNSGIIPSSLRVYEPPVQTVAVVRGTDSNWPPQSNIDTISPLQTILKVSKTPDGNSDYVGGTDWVSGAGVIGAGRDADIKNNEIEWLPGGNQPAVGSTYYVTETSSWQPTPVSYTLNGNTITLATPPTAGQAVFVQYVYNTPTLKYQQTSAGDGGFNSIYVDDSYSARFLGKYLALGLNWLDGYSGLTPDLQGQVVNTLQQWFNALPSIGYNYNSPESNYGAGEYVSQVFTALALQGMTTDAAQMLANVEAYRQTNVLPDLQNPTTSLNGGYWAEGWNYGQLASEGILQAGLALEEAGQVTATAEHQWASQVIEQVIEASPSPGTIYNGGDWYAYPAPFPRNDFFDIFGAMASNPTEQAYANYILQNNPSGNSNSVWDLLFRNPSAPAANPSSLPLQYLAQGTGLLTARSDWGSTPTWVSFQMGNLLGCDHQSYTPGQLQIQRGADDLLVNATSVGEWQGLQKSQYGNVVVVNANGDTSLQTYPYSMGAWYGNPGVTVTNYDAPASGNYVYMAGNYAAAYSPYSNPGSGGPVSQLTREMVYLRPDYVVVYDRVTTLQADYYKSQQWNFLNAPVVNGNSFVETVGSSKLFGQTFSTTSLTLTEKSVQVADANIQELEIQNTSPTASVNYLTAFQTAPSTTTSMDATEHILTTDGRMEGSQIGNQLVLFGVAAGTVDLTTPVTYSVSGSSSVTNLLVDLQAGATYQIEAGGTSLGNVTASSQGTISFTTPAGTNSVTVIRIG